jgi:hypothetical protein
MAKFTLNNDWLGVMYMLVVALFSAFDKPTPML